MSRTVQQFLIATILSLLATSASADSITMTFKQTLDLVSGTISDANFLPGYPTGADVLISNNADPVEHAVVFPAGDTVEIVFVANFLCINLIPAAVAGIIFTSESMGLTASTTSRVVERSDQGLLFEFGARSNPA